MNPSYDPPSLIVGLGNPDPKLLNTRHNIGFWFIDELVKQLDIPVNENTKKGYIDATYESQDHIIKIIKPMTYINDSGTPLQKYVKNTNIQTKNIIVAYDDLDLSPGKLRLKFGGGSGGHNGIRDIIEKLGSKDFWRLKIGIGKPSLKDEVISYVLGKPSVEDRNDINFGIKTILNYCNYLTEGDYSSFMNCINGDINGV